MKAIIRVFLLKIALSFILNVVRLEAQRQTNITQATATLSEARYWLAGTSSGELVFFGGGYNTTNASTAQVDICNVTSGNWTTASLSVPRGELAATSSGNLVLFAGGSSDLEANVTDHVDIYNISNGSWSTATLSQARHRLAATSVPNLVLFGGGYNSSSLSNIVDIYNVTSNMWTATTLSQPRCNMGATSVANRYALFAGGLNSTGSSNMVDIYDAMNGVWNTTTLSQPSISLAATSLGNLTFFVNGSDGNISNIVDIFNATTRTWSTATLSQVRGNVAAASFGEVVAFGGGWNGTTYSSVVDMYNVTSNNWFTVSLSQSRCWLAATSSTNKIFFSGGWNDSSEPVNIVDIFDLSDVSPNTEPIHTSPSPVSPSISGIIVGVIVATILLVMSVGLTLVVVLLLKRRKQNERRENDSHLKLKNKSVVNENATMRKVSTQRALSYSQIPYSELAIEREIGEGSYGKIFYGHWFNTPVALKFCKYKPQLVDFIKEMKLLIKLPPHPNVVHVYGVATDGLQPVIVMEYCAGGSLDKLLFDLHTNISEKYKIRLVRGIACGMRHLHKHNVVHCDLAARNILLTDINEPKICDFGMSRILERTSSKAESNVAVGSVCWMASESLVSGCYNKKTDVWTFGIVVYEIVAQCEPHKDKDVIDVAILIKQKGLTPIIPRDCPQKLRQLMEMCWNKEPEQRPTFEAICRLLGA